MKDKKLWTHENFGKENEISYICKTLLQLVIQPVIKKSDSRLRSSDFANHSRDYKPNWIPLSHAVFLKLE